MQKYTKRKGLKGPYSYPNGRVVYFDPKQNEYWDPTTDWYISREEMESLKNSMLDLVKG